MFDPMDTSGNVAVVMAFIVVYLPQIVFNLRAVLTLVMQTVMEKETCVSYFQTITKDCRHALPPAPLSTSRSSRQKM